MVYGVHDCNHIEYVPTAVPTAVPTLHLSLLPIMCRNLQKDAFVTPRRFESDPGYYFEWD